jgi:radical SAM protein with 4Fe4S-binding SPASM domain
VDAKKLLTNKSICTLPWSGFELEPSGTVKNCIISKTKLGDINKTNIKDIMQSKRNIELKESMLKDQKPHNCSGCYLQEKQTKDLSSISSRLYYLKELGTKTNLDFYDDTKNFALKHVDLRWTNSCNQACVYCGPRYSSKWAQELGEKVKSNKEARQEVKDYVFENIAQLENVYLAGGEPMLMKENFEFLTLLKEKNPNCHIRVNSNLSTTATGIFELLCSFEHVHWTVSVESIEEEYNYIRHLGNWNDFVKNLDVINKLDHKISFNMLHFILNYKSIHNCIDFLKGKGFGDNSFIAGPLYTPPHLNTMNLPDPMLNNIIQSLKDKLDTHPQGYLKNSYENLIKYYTTTNFNKNLKSFYYNLGKMDQRRNQNGRLIFSDLFNELDKHELE